MIRALPLWVMGATLAACDSPTSGKYWEFAECSELDLALIERGVEEAIPIEAYVDAGLSNRFTGDVPAYGEIFARLIEVYSEGEVHCGTPAEGVTEGFSGLVFNERQSILVNVEDSNWSRDRDSWAAAQEYGALSAAEVEARVAPMGAEEFLEFRDTAEDYLLAPATATNILMHESAHLVTPYCCSHPIGEPDRECDFVDMVGVLASHGVYWARWHDESQWLDQLYWSRHTE